MNLGFINKYRRFTKLAIPMVLLGFLFASCEERFTPELDSRYENVLVVEGEITNMPGPYIVKLTSSVSLDGGLAMPLSGYFVEIEDDEGNAEVLNEMDAGIYSTAIGGLQGVVGRRYRINIASNKGQEYSSDFEVLRPPPPIDSVYAQIDYQADENLPYDLGGYQFYANSHLSANEKTYYLWRLNATYKYASDFIIRWIFDGQLRPFTNSDSLRYCYTNRNIYQYFIFNNENFASTTLEAFPLHFVAVDVRDLSIRYSLFTTQYSMSKSAYTFWSRVKEQNENLDDLYTRQPFQVRGNIYNTLNNNEPVLGYFMVAGKSEKRIFVNRPGYPVEMRYGVCMLTEPDYMRMRFLFDTPPDMWPEYATFDNNGASAYPSQECLDCREKGGTIEKPDFWIDP